MRYVAITQQYHVHPSMLSRFAIRAQLGGLHQGRSARIQIEAIDRIFSTNGQATCSRACLHQYRVICRLPATESVGPKCGS